MDIYLYPKIYYNDFVEKVNRKEDKCYGTKSRAKSSTLRICLTAVFMALNVAVSSFGIPMPGSGHLYLCDVVICIAAIILDPVSAFLVGGIGSFWEIYSFTRLQW